MLVRVLAMPAQGRPTASQWPVTEAEAEEQANIFRVRYGLDKSLPLQFVDWIWGIVSEGSFGFSFAYKRDVGELIAERAPRTLLLAVLAHLTSSDWT